MEKNKKIMESIKDKKVTLFLGNTGAGKSTIINKRLGHT